MNVTVFEFLRLAKISRAIGALCIGLLATAANAALTYNIDFNRNAAGALTYSGTAIAPDTGTTWNGVSGTGSNGSFMLNAANDLLDSLGNVGTADLTATTIYGSFSNDGGTAVNPHDLMYDYITLRGGNNPGNAGGVTLTVSDLPNGAYKLYIYGAGDADGQSGVFQVAAANQVMGGISSGTTLSTNRNINDAGNPGVNYVVLDAMTVGGSLAFQWNLGGDVNSSGVFSGLNGFQIQQVVPEPASAVMFVVAMIGMVNWRRNRQIA